MKKNYLSILIFFISLSIFSQEKISNTQNWKDENFEKTGIYGVGTNDALQFLKSKGIKPTKITVAVLDSGVEIDHEDLKANIWINPREKAKNKKDDDKNGYIDDINGWDFIGGKDGQDVDIDTYEMTRIVAEYEKLFEGNNSNKNTMPEKYTLYKTALEAYDKKKTEDTENAQNYYQYKNVYPVMLDDVAEITGENKLTKEYLSSLSIINEKTRRFVNYLIESNETANYTAAEYKNKVLDELNEVINHLEESTRYQLNKNFDPRPTIGDNYNDKKEKYYGNNEVEGPDANHGTHVAGIIAADRKNGKGVNGIAGDVAKILVVRTVPNGDERDKDVANAIRYAADNGAKIMNMSFGKDYSPEKEIVWEAIAYADNKGILMFHAAGNDNKNVDIEPNFPTNFKNNTAFTKNWITVGASTIDPKKLRANFSNFGKTKVDIFAPGKDIYSTITNGMYKENSGTSMASPVAAGCAALLWAYFPKLTSKQVKDILFSTVNKSDIEVEVGEENLDMGIKSETKKFSELSSTGGVIDVFKAVKMAYEITKKGKK